MSCEDQIVNHDPSVALSFSADTILILSLLQKVLLPAFEGL